MRLRVQSFPVVLDYWNNVSVSRKHLPQGIEQLICRHACLVCSAHVLSPTSLLHAVAFLRLWYDLWLCPLLLNSLSCRWARLLWPLTSSWFPILGFHQLVASRKLSHLQSAAHCRFNLISDHRCTGLPMHFAILLGVDWRLGPVRSYRA